MLERNAIGQPRPLAHETDCHCVRCKCWRTNQPPPEPVKEPAETKKAKQAPPSLPFTVEDIPQ